MRSRIRAQAQVNAYRVLARRYPQQYRQQYQIEKDRLFAEIEQRSAKPTEGELDS